MFDPANVDIRTNKNGVLRTAFTLTKDAQPLDLTGWEIEMQVRQKPGTAVMASAQTGGASPDGSVITITEGAAGKFEVFISNIDFQDIVFPAGATANDGISLQYDILFRNPSNGDLLPLIKGTFTVFPGITIHD